MLVAVSSRINWCLPIVRTFQEDVWNQTTLVSACHGAVTVDGEKVILYKVDADNFALDLEHEFSLSYSVLTSTLK